MGDTTELRALRAFAKAIDAISVTRWGDCRLEEFQSRDDCMRYGDASDRKKWAAVVRSHKRLIELGVIAP